MKVQMSFDYFKEEVKKVLHFEREFTDSQWNIQYQFFKDDINRSSENWKGQFSTSDLIINWAKEFYKDASADSHYYWLK